LNSKDIERTLIYLATGIVQLHDNILQKKTVRMPYPLPLQQGMHKLAAWQIHNKQKPIVNLQDFLQMAHQPLSSWKLDVPEGYASESDKLLDYGIPTNFCMQWAHEKGADAYQQEQLLPKVMDTCRRENNPDAYTAFRMLLVRQPAISAIDLQRAKMNPQLRALASELGEAYTPAPPSAIVDGSFQLCAHCGSLLLRIDNNTFQCENERCRLRGYRVGNMLDAQTGVLWLTGGLRRYVSQPGLAEIELQNELQALGIEVEMWVNFDAYDLRITLGNEVWAIDVKDWANPFLLASHAGPIRRTPSWNRAFYIFPDERQQQRSDYLRAFENYWDRPSNTDALMHSDFLKLVRKKMEQLS
jgi:hypothetical protein